MTSSTRLAVAVLLLLISRPALAWNAAGHMVSASIAYDVLKRDDPTAITRTLDTLRQHPQYAEHFADKLKIASIADRPLKAHQASRPR